MCADVNTMENKNTAVINAINRVFRERINCDTEEQLAVTCLDTLEKLTGSKFGFIGEVNAVGLFDTIAISNPGMEACEIPKGKLSVALNNLAIRGIDRTTIIEGKPRIVNDLTDHPDSVGMPEGHPKVYCFLGVPLIHAGKTVGMIGLANKENGYDISDQKAVESLSVAFLEALYSKRAEERISTLAQEILNVSTPIMQIWDSIVVAPLIGSLDSQRTQQFMELLLNAVVATKSEIAIVDITGVPTVDTQTAQHLLETTSAVKLLGAKLILTGVRPAIAQTLVHLGVDLAGLITRSSLSAGLKVAFEILGLTVKQNN